MDEKLSKTIFDTAQTELTKLNESIEQMKSLSTTVEHRMNKAIRSLDIADVNVNAFEIFMQKPYHLEQIKTGVFRLLVPKFINFSAGWPVTTTDQWNIFHVSAFINLLTPLPPWLLEEMDVEDPGFRAHIEGDWLIIDEGDPTDTWEKLGRGKRFSRRDGKLLRMKPASQFEIKRQLLRKGVNFFIPKPILKEDLRSPQGKITLKEKQDRDFKKFLEFGAVSLFAPGGSGKTYFGLYACDVLKGKKLVVVDSTVLCQQWEARLEEYLPFSYQEVEVKTYKWISMRKSRQVGPYSLVIFDEIQTIPSNTGLKAAQVNTKYRMGLSATPWREDGNEDIIPAITGLPVGSDWRGIEKSDAIIWVVKEEGKKLNLALDLLQEETPGKTMVFVHRIAFGERASKYLGLPFFHGSTGGNRIMLMEENDSFIVSSIATQGVSLNITRIIELDWLGGRREAGQREYRLSHGEGKGIMHIIMTRAEFHSQPGKRRLSAIYALSEHVEIRGG